MMIKSINTTAVILLFVSAIFSTTSLYGGNDELVKGIKTVVIPKENERDLEEIPENVKSDLEIHCVQWIDEVLKIALQDNPEGFEIAK